MSQQRETQVNVEVRPTWKFWRVQIGPRGLGVYIREDTEYEVKIENSPVNLDQKTFTFNVAYREVELDSYREVEEEEKVILSNVEKMIKLVLEYAREKNVNNVNLYVLDSRPDYCDC